MLDNLLSPQRIPPPPPLPKYDPNEEAPKWTFYRTEHHLFPVDKPLAWTSIGTQPDSPDKPDWRGVIRDKVIELPVPEPYKFGKPIDPKYFWFDTPDYADPFKKLGYSLKFFTLSGMCLLSLNGILKGYKFTFKNNLILFRTTFAPWILSGMAASLTVITLANLRGKKDDMLNYGAAGIVMAATLSRNHAQFFRYGVTMPLFSIFTKYNAENNGELIPQWDYRFGSYRLLGSDAEHGISSGDLRLGLRSNKSGDPGRDIRTF